MSTTPVQDEQTSEAATEESSGLEAAYAYEDEEDASSAIAETAPTETPGEQPPAEAAPESDAEPTAEPVETPSEGEPEESDQSEQTDEINDDLKARALAVGFSETDVASFGSAAEAERAITALDRNLIQYGRSLQTPQGAQPPAQPAVAPGVQPQVPQTPTVQPTQPTPYQVSDELRAEADEALVKEFERLAKHMTDQVAPLQNGLIQLNTNVSARAEWEFRNNMDGLYADLEDDLATVYGTERTQTLTQDSPKTTARTELENDMAALALACLSSTPPRPLPELPDLFRRAVHARHGDLLKKQALNEVSRKLDKRANGIVARPTGRANRNLDSQENVLKEADEWAAQHGLGPGASVGAEEAF